METILLEEDGTKKSKETTKSGNTVNNKVVRFEPDDGIKYCKECGSSFDVSVNKCTICDNNDFVTGKAASYIAGYIKISNNGYLKKYAKRMGCNRTILQKTNRHICYWLLTEKDKLEIDESVIRKIYWKRY